MRELDLLGVAAAMQTRALAMDAALSKGLGRVMLGIEQTAAASIGNYQPAVAGFAALPSDAAPGLELPWLDAAVGATLLVWVLWQAWTYRDAIAAKIQKWLPRVAAYLRRF